MSTAESSVFNNIDKNVTSSEKTASSKRIIYLDYLRVLATIAVITIHSSLIKWNEIDYMDKAYHATNLYNSISRWAVPVFL